MDDNLDELLMLFKQPAEDEQQPEDAVCGSKNIEEGE